MVTPFSWYLMDLHTHYVNGNLAVAGGVTDQPGVYLDAMAHISEWVANANNS